MKNCLSQRAGKPDWKGDANYERFFSFDFDRYPLCVPLTYNGFFFRLQFIDVHGFVSERTFDRADQFKADHMGTFRAPWKILAFADCH